LVDQARRRELLVAALAVTLRPDVEHAVVARHKRAVESLAASAAARGISLEQAQQEADQRRTSLSRV
jgi:hypothetical protein